MGSFNDPVFILLLASTFAFLGVGILFFIRDHLYKAAFLKNSAKVALWTFLAVFVLSCGVLFYLRSHTPAALTAQNEQRLDAWQAQGCVAPERITKSVFVATNTSLTGLATAFKLEGDVLVTNRHVAEVLPQAVFVSSEGEMYLPQRSHVANKQTRPDLAFYMPPQEMDIIPGLPLATKEPQPGDFLLVVGNNGQKPLFYPSVVEVVESSPRSWLTKISGALRGVFSTFSSASVLVDEGAQKSDPYLLHGDVAGGNSGSPVVNCTGEVVGVLYGRQAIYWFANENVGSAVTLPDLRQELEELPAKDGQMPPLT